jgi:hypothetical protein
MTLYLFKKAQIYLNLFKKQRLRVKSDLRNKTIGFRIARTCFIICPLPLVVGNY